MAGDKPGPHGRFEHLTDEAVALAYLQAGENTSKLARLWQVSRSAVRHQLDKRGTKEALARGEYRKLAEELESVDVAPGETKKVQTGDSLMVGAKKFGIETYAQLVKACDIDEDEWECTFFQVRPFPMHMGKFDAAAEEAADELGRDERTGHGGLVQGFSLTARFRPWSHMSGVRRTARFLEAIKREAPKRPKIRRPKGRDRTLMAGLFDLHFGKIPCWNERGELWGVETAMRESMAVVEKMAQYAERESVGSIIFPFGQDFLHIDTRQNTTTAGTPQDVAAGHKTLLEAGEAWLIDALRLLSEVAPVEAIGVEGNHDRISTHALGRILYWAFDRDKNVTVDSRPLKRKYRLIGRTVLGFAHYDVEVKSEAHTMFMRESIEQLGGLPIVPSSWEIFTGHRHTLQVDERQKVRVRRLPSLTPSDEYHESHGYASLRAAQAMLIDPQTGVQGGREVCLPTFLPPMPQDGVTP